MSIVAFSASSVDYIFVSVHFIQLHHGAKSETSVFARDGRNLGDIFSYLEFPVVRLDTKIGFSK